MSGGRLGPQEMRLSNAAPCISGAGVVSSNRKLPLLVSKLVGILHHGTHGGVDAVVGPERTIRIRALCICHLGPIADHDRRADVFGGQNKRNQHEVVTREKDQ